MTKNQKVNTLIIQIEKKSWTSEEQINEFLAQDSINALGIVMSEYGVLVLYEDKI